MQHALYHDIVLAEHHITVKRLDMLDDIGSGNKGFKLKYNLQQAQLLGKKTLLTFGGAYSNHIAAVSAIGHRHGFKTIGMIRGDELAAQALNPTLQRAHDIGMQLHFLSRGEYRRRYDANFLAQLQQQYPDCYLLPEGGSNEWAVQGCQEILTPEDAAYDVICCAVGTGATLAGIINATHEHQFVHGFAALKGDFLSQAIRQWTSKHNWHVSEDNIFGGYARYDTRLLDFIIQMKRDFNLPLEPIYTAKALYALKQHLEQHPSQARILFIHTGGLQGFVAPDQSQL